jgi:gamma-glutamyltranspeptidase/glutathione hydrolase
VIRTHAIGFLTLLTFILAAGCSGGSSDDLDVSRARKVERFNGLVLADEPQAAAVAREVLETGGNAADAATAAYFALSVTYPMAAGLGGGGLCLVYANAMQRVEGVSFLMRDTHARGKLAIPGNVRGFALLQARYGKLAWGRLLAPAEHLAVKGGTVSRALRQRLEAAAGDDQAAAVLDRYFRDAAGNLPEEGTPLQLFDLSRTLAAIREGGPSAFYRGTQAGRLIAASEPTDRIGESELAAFRPEFFKPATQAINRRILFIPPSSLGAGAFAAALWPQLSGTSGERDDMELVRQTAQAGLRAFGLSEDLSENFGSTGFAVVDHTGSAVSCAVTMGRPFGAGIIAGDTGVIFASSPASGTAGYASAFLLPVIATDNEGEELSFAGTGAGKPVASAAILRLAVLATQESRSLAAQHMMFSGGQDASVNYFSCISGFSDDAEGCSYAADKSGHGLAFAAAPARNGQ